MKRKRICIWAVLLALALAAVIFCYYQFFWEAPKNVQGGTLVHEQHIVYPNRQKC